MDEQTILKGIVDSYPYPIVFVDNDYIIRFVNRYARYHYYQERGYGDLVGKSLFVCHGKNSAEAVKAGYERMKTSGNEIFIGVSNRNWRIYMQGVRNEAGELIGFFERFELNHRIDSTLSAK